MGPHACARTRLSIDAGCKHPSVKTDCVCLDLVGLEDENVSRQTGEFSVRMSSSVYHAIDFQHSVGIVPS